MDTQVEELIDRIKRDGVAAAENSASLKISQAEKEAEKTRPTISGIACAGRKSTD